MQQIWGHIILWGFPSIFYLKIKIRRQLINIHEVTELCLPDTNFYVETPPPSLFMFEWWNSQPRICFDF